MSDNILDRFKENIAEEKIRTGRKLKVGIIGAGWIAEAHVNSYKKMDDVEIVAVADLIDGKAQKFIEQYGLTDAKAYSSDVEMLEKVKDLDAVSISTYNATHASCAINALNAGVNVLLEKPFTVTLDEAVEVMKAEKESGKVLSIGFQPRLDANMQIETASRARLSSSSISLWEAYSVLTP